jgi:hypothetical protein
MIRLYGWAEVGHRLVDAVPHGHWNTSTFIASLRQDGLVAPCAFNGAINGELFLAYVEQVLVPTRPPGSARQSKPPVPDCTTCQPTALI